MKLFSLCLAALAVVSPAVFARPTEALAAPTAAVTPLGTPAAQIHTPRPDDADVSNAPKTVAATAITRGPDFVTFTITNHHTAPIYTKHEVNEGYSTERDRMATPGVMEVGAIAEFAVPTGWGGRVAVVENGGGRSIIGDESLIEDNYVVPNRDGFTVAVANVDVSYVDGFTVPIVCGCEGAGLVTGCSKDPWKLGTPCPADNGVGSCKNPLRADTTATQAHEFFRP
ncbi:hypothetical protein GE09DRAFT_1230894 [Coniochaeta sp. 2T2.1]|nr:hypothetical protein GE09DRAFT_1230894 [Coniochaeta sp. 2T2.1]